MTQRQPRLHDRGFLAYLRKQRCCCCYGHPPVEAAHIRMGSPSRGKSMTGMQEKPSDKWAVPLCDLCHRLSNYSVHGMGEAAFWKSEGMDPFVIAEFNYRSYGGTGGKPAPTPKIKPRKPRHLRAKIQSRNTLRKAT